MSARLFLSLAVVVAAASCGSPSQPPGGCSAEKSPPNVIVNGSFDCAVSDAWSMVFGSTFAMVEGGRAGQAAQVTVSSLGGRIAYAKDIVAGPSSKSFCFTGWVKGTAPYMRMRVLRDMGGSVSEVSQSAPVTGQWTQIPAIKVEQLNAPRLQLMFEAQTNRTDAFNAKEGDTLLVDDVDAWEFSGSCENR